MKDFSEFLETLEPNKISYDAVEAVGKNEDMISHRESSTHNELYKLSVNTTIGIVTAYLRAYHNWLQEQLGE